MKTFILLFAGIYIFAMCVFGPFTWLSLLNKAFDLHIPLTLQTWVASIVSVAVILFVINEDMKHDNHNR